MTSRLDAWSVSESRLSDADAARMAAEAALHAANRRRAVRAVAGSCTDLDDARMLFEMLGLDATDLRAAREPSGDKPRGRKRSVAA